MRAGRRCRGPHSAPIGPSDLDIWSNRRSVRGQPQPKPLRQSTQRRLRKLLEQTLFSPPRVLGASIALALRLEHARLVIIPRTVWSFLLAEGGDFGVVENNELGGERHGGSLRPRIEIGVNGANGCLLDRA